MNIQEKDILNTLSKEPFVNQRVLSEISGHSLGIVNRSINGLIGAGYLDDKISLTDKAITLLEDSKPRRAIILAAGFGMRMVPINMETPKGLLEVAKEPLIERLIKQLHEVNIYDISIIVGFMKEKYEYLIDLYGVNLVVNSQYASKNNLYSLSLVVDKLKNSYIIPCDIWCDTNPFRMNELYSWYMVSDMVDDDSTVRVNRKMELAVVPENTGGNAMIGIAYLLDKEAELVKNQIIKMSMDSRYDGVFWEEALYNKNKMIVSARVVHSSEVMEINTYEQLRELDCNSNHLKTDAIEIVAQTFGVNNSEITDITVLKKGMTNRSFLFTCQGKKYIMRIPGEGTEMLINRKQEAQVYNVLAGKQICDNVIYMNPNNGYKITEFITNVRNCDPMNEQECRKCMKYLRGFHEMELTVDHEFDLYKMINFYESLWDGNPSIYRDYDTTKKNIWKLREFVELHAAKKVLTHIDAVADNFLFAKDSEGKETIRLIDWEYAGMQDPHVDIAMFCIYALYDRAHVDQLIDMYFEEGCSKTIRIKIYCYIAICGLLWSNWCEYKRNLGVEFGEYSLRQYRYAKEYFRIVEEEMEEEV